MVAAVTLNDVEKDIAENTLALLGLDKAMQNSRDEQGALIAQDRVAQRMQVWSMAEDSLEDYQNHIENSSVMGLIVKLMVSSGFFSVWMTVFKDYPELKIKFVEAVSGGLESGCYDHITAEKLSPHPNEDGLEGGGKI